MNGKERYYNYIVDDLMKTTEINVDVGTIHLPIHPMLFMYPLSDIIRFDWRSPRINRLLTKTCISKYGAKEAEIQTIWKLYRERILKLISNG
tara:strand:- start:1043 stop:1318 length:276 start_codon:yes stop_codon:yes gene_type:complete